MLGKKIRGEFGTVIGEDMELSGTLNDKENIYVNGKVEGKIKTRTLVIAEGVFFNGECTMVSRAASTEEGTRKKQS